VSANSGLTAIVAAVLVRDGRVLLCLRSSRRRWSPCMWDLPGGHVERGESDPVALARELCEELGVSVAPATIAATLPVVRIIDHEVDMRVWVVEDWSGEASQLEQLSLAHPEYRGLLRRVGAASAPAA
jgi:8-oxo-dGTP diphosphatase